MLLKNVFTQTIFYCCNIKNRKEKEIFTSPSRVSLRIESATFLSGPWLPLIVTSGSEARCFYQIRTYNDEILHQTGCLSA